MMHYLVSLCVLVKYIRIEILYKYCGRMHREISQKSSLEIKQTKEDPPEEKNKNQFFYSKHICRTVRPKPAPKSMQVLFGSQFIRLHTLLINSYEISPYVFSENGGSDFLMLETSTLSIEHSIRFFVFHLPTQLF